MGIAATDPTTGKPTFNDVSTTQADLQALADFAVRAFDLQVPTATALPSTGNWPGRRAIAADTGIPYWNTDGAAGWKRILTGLNRVRPTSVVGGTLNADGSVSFAAAASIAFDGIFTTAFSKYLIEFDQTTTSANCNIAYLERSGGSDNAATYFWNLIYSTGGAPGGTQGLSNSAIQLTAFPSLYRHISLNVYNPAAAAIRTMVKGDSTETDTTNMGQSRASGWHGTPAAIDGFKIQPLVAGPTLTGTIDVYGIG